MTTTAPSTSASRSNAPSIQERVKTGAVVSAVGLVVLGLGALYMKVQDFRVQRAKRLIAKEKERDARRKKRSRYLRAGLVLAGTAAVGYGVMRAKVYRGKQVQQLAASNPTQVGLV